MAALIGLRRGGLTGLFCLAGFAVFVFHNKGFGNLIGKMGINTSKRYFFKNTMFNFYASLKYFPTKTVNWLMVEREKVNNILQYKARFP